LSILFSDISNNQIRRIFRNSNTVVSELFALTELDDFEYAVVNTFTNTCIENSKDSGWAPRQVVDSLRAALEAEFNDNKTAIAWFASLDHVVKGDVEGLQFDDGGKPVLRAVILVLLNSEPQGIKQLLRSQVPIGDLVGRLALAFATLRLGYSYLTAPERAERPELKESIQALKLAYLNNQLGALDSEPASEANVISEPELLPLSQIPSILLPLETTNDGELYSINGVVPKAGYDLTLGHSSNGELSLTIIDFTTEKPAKFAGKAVVQALQVQSELPPGSRFELDDSVLKLVLPSDMLVQPTFNEEVTTVLKLLQLSIKPMQTKSKILK